MSEHLISEAQKIRNKYKSGELSSSDYFRKMAAFGKKHNIGGVFTIEQILIKSQVN